jgi:two-component system CheB/CheR fusion protein
LFFQYLVIRSIYDAINIVKLRPRGKNLKKTKKSKKIKIVNKVKTAPAGPGHDLSKDATLFPVVGIGASAGGLEALEQFFANVDINSGMAYVVIQHLDPTREGILPELLQRMTKMKVAPVTDGVKVMPNCVYVIPSNKSMSILKGALYLFEPVEKDGLRLPIDFFLRSLAEDMHERAIGVILSGMGSDGSNGMRDIKEKSGITAIQEPANAKFDSMPRNAAEAVIIDITAPANELPGRLAAFFNILPADKEGPEIEIKSVNNLEKIIILIRDSTGNDFSMYKNTMVSRRIERRMGIHQLAKMEDYVRYLRENPAEVQLLFKELLIGVTNFFRDPKVWESLKTKIIPELIAENAGKSRLRGWVPACSTGEEAYSLAIIFKEALDAALPGKKMSLQIFATDIDTDAIDKARKGFFRENIAADVSPERLSRFFKAEKNGYRVNSEIREMIIFAPQNAVKDPPFTSLDIISCRNLLIYLENGLQKKLISLFHYSINLNGIMVLGSAETIGDKDQVFVSVDPQNKIYKCAARGGKEVIPYTPAVLLSHKPGLNKIPEPGKSGENIQNLAEQLILNHFSPASVLVNEKGDIIYITGHTGKYLEPAAGKSNWNIFAMLREGMLNEFSKGFRKAVKQKKQVIIRNIHVEYLHEAQDTDVLIKRLENPSVLSGLILVVFTDVRVDSAAKLLSGKKVKTGRKGASAALETELQRTRDNLKANLEEMQTSEEELRSANEEQQSNNEELQSTNEELTTSKEEMQSLNEELQTVNAEMQSKLDTFERTNNDMKNLLNSTEIAVLFIDKEMRITRFTSTATKIFRLIPADIGRPFTDFNSGMVYPDIISDIKEVMRTLSVLEKDVPTSGGDWFRVRIMPYKTIDERIDGFVLTFTGITASKHLEAALHETGRIFQSLMDSGEVSIINVSKDGKILGFNSVAEKDFAIKREEAAGKDYFDLLVPEPIREKIRTDIRAVLEGGMPAQYETGIKAASGGEITVKWQASRMMDEKGAAVGVMIVGMKTAQDEK